MAELSRIYDYLSNDNLTIHQKAVNIWLLSNKAEDFPKMPPNICPCIITLKNGSRFRAYLDEQKCFDWIEYGNSWSVRVNGRRNWSRKDVIKWEFTN